jgi:hypothetical protein
MKSERIDQRLAARETLSAASVPIGADFHTLTSEQVGRLLAEAEMQHYRRPRFANGSRARYFHDMLQRRAQRLAN